MSSRREGEVVEAIGIGDVTLKIIRYGPRGQAYHMARFTIYGESDVETGDIGGYSLDDLSNAATVGRCILEYLECGGSIMDVVDELKSHNDLHREEDSEVD